MLAVFIRVVRPACGPLLRVRLNPEPSSILHCFCDGYALFRDCVCRHAVLVTLTSFRHAPTYVCVYCGSKLTSARAYTHADADAHLHKHTFPAALKLTWFEEVVACEEVGACDSAHFVQLWRGREGERERERGRNLRSTHTRTRTYIRANTHMDTHTYVHVCTYGGGRQNGCVVRLGRSMGTKNETVSEK